MTSGVTTGPATGPATGPPNGPTTEPATGPATGPVPGPHNSLPAGLAIGPPRTAAAWAAYYGLRYAVLRQPWQQPPGSETLPDDAAPGVTHALLADAHGAALAVGRLQPSAPGQGQVRMVAVAPAAQGQGLGQALMHHLEAQARAAGLREVVLHARQNAVPFYQRLGYAVHAPSYTLFGAIPHFLMTKTL